MTFRMPALFLGHGSPMTVITDNPARRGFIDLAQRLPRPSAILCITAHWETQNATHLTANAWPRTIHDFGGFPQELFDMRYPAPGNVQLVERVIELAGPDRVRPDKSWGFDHGVWCVTQPMFPACDVPTVAMSVNRSLSTDDHLALARRLAPLREEGVLIIGSGNIIHNLRYWYQWANGMPDEIREFGDRIIAAVKLDDAGSLAHFSPDDRAAALAVNSAEHYLPLLYPAGVRMADDEVQVFNHDSIDGVTMASFIIGAQALQ